MIIKTPPLSIKIVPIVAPLFKAQMPDTLNAIRQSIPDWMAVHVTVPNAAAIRKPPLPDQMRDELLAQLKPQAMLFDPIYTLTTPQIPPNTIATFVPDQIRPAFASSYESWKFVIYKDARTLLAELFERALGGIPDGNVGVADALLGKFKGQVGLEGWSGSLSIPGYTRTMEALIDPDAPVMFWDNSFGFETTGAAFLKMSQFIIGMFGAKDDRLYFDAANFSWFVVFHSGGQVRVGIIE